MQTRIGSFFAQLTTLQNEPDDAVRRVSFVNNAKALTQEFNQLSAFLTKQKSDILTQTQVGVQTVNAKLANLFDLNRQIKDAVFQGYQPNDLLDQHQQVLNDLAGWLDIEATPSGAGFSYRIANVHVTTGDTPFELQSNVDKDGKLVISTKRNDVPLDFVGGSFEAWTTAYNEQIPQTAKQLDTLAMGLITAFDSVHATGLGLNGPFSVLNGQRPVSNVNSPLAESAAPFPLTAGDLFVSITDSNGARTLEKISFDPKTESLTDFAAKLSSLNHIQAVVDAPTGQISILAENGYTFDFAGRLPSVPLRTNITGDAKINFGGLYDGAERPVRFHRRG